MVMTLSESLMGKRHIGSVVEVLFRTIQAGKFVLLLLLTPICDNVECNLGTDGAP